MKDKTIGVRLDERDQERLALLTDHLELSQSAIIRMLIKRAAEEIEAARAQGSTVQLTLVKPPAKPLFDTPKSERPGFTRPEPLCVRP